MSEKKIDLGEQFVWEVECVSTATRRHLARTAEQVDVAVMMGIDVDVPDTCTIRAASYLEPWPGAHKVTFDQWLMDVAKKIPAGYSPTRITGALGTQPSRVN